MSKYACLVLLCLASATMGVRGWAAEGSTDRIDASVTLQFEQAKTRIAPEIYGQFAEHLGHCIYGGIWVGDDSSIPNTRGIRNDVVAALKNLHVPVVRWPGGCFADEYHWRNGIGPRDKRPKMINTHWGGVVEDNSFGTHEFLDFCEQIGCEPYVCGNVGSGTVQEMMEWVEYMTSDADSPLANLRRQNGRDNPWKLKYFAVGNESWGCGGNMTPEFYANEFRRYNTFIKDYPGNKIYRVAGGPNSADYNWTEVLMKNVGNKMQGLSLHYYTLPTGNWQHKGSATDFDEAAYHATLVNAFKMEDMIKKHAEIMDKYDAGKHIGLVVDEWGNWYDVEPGANPGFLYQQNSLRDALTAAYNLDLFQAHADRISMANIAQMINVLQSMILTDKDKMVLTPTYHVFEMYNVHQGATLIPLEVKTPDYELGGKSVPAVHATASQNKEGKVHISLVNLDANRPAHITAKIPNGNSVAAARILTADTLTAHNTFEKPDMVKPAEFKQAKVDGDMLVADLPSKSIVVVELQKSSAAATASTNGAATSGAAGDETPKRANMALAATPTTSFVSGDQSILAINDGGNPNNRAKQHYGNWPRGGTQWVQYTWPQPISTNKVDVYWFVDGRGLHLPKACRLKYFDGDKFVDVPNATGLGIERGAWNETTFDEITTTKIRLEFDAEGGQDISTGINQFRVFDSGKSPKFPPRVKAGPDRVVVLGAKTFLNGSSRGIDDTDTAKLTWSKTSGPGEATFDDPHSPVTRAAFSKLGDYTLSLSAKVGDLASSDALHVQVEPAATAAHLEPVYTTHYKLNSPLWNSRAKALIVNWIPHCYNEISDLNLREGGIANLIEAGKKLRGEPAKMHVGFPFANAWIYNTLESMCIAQMVDPNGDQEMIDAQKAMRDKIEEWIPIILAAQEPDGYLQSRFTLGAPQDRGNPPPHWDPRRGRGEHEGYVAGYFLEAAISHYNMTDGKDRRLYDAAKKLADCWCDNLGPPPKKAWYDGHQEMEQALVRFARMVDHVEGVGKGDKYTQLAKFLIESRAGGSQYDQSYVPAVEQYEAVGHAVRAGYFYSGMADIAMMTHDPDFQSAVCSISDNIVNRKYYITGGIGSGETSEGFGPDYSLRNNAYCESCSGTAVLFFDYKLDLTFQDAKYADLMEETLYNAILGDIDLVGKNFCYTNELETAGTPDPRFLQPPDNANSGYANYHAPLLGFRYPWHTCPCCVGNIPRTLLMLPTWMYATSPDSLYVNLFIGSMVQVPNVAGTSVRMEQTTRYPWDGKVAISVNPEQSKRFTLRIRVPNRTTSELYEGAPSVSGLVSLSVNGESMKPEIEQGYAVITRQWQAGDKVEFELPMKPQRVKAIDKVAADRGLVAIKYGPLVYNFEQPDNPNMGPRVLPTLKTDSSLKAQWKPDLLGGVVAIEAQAPDGSPLLAIPNYARNNRSGRSAVWIKAEDLTAPPASN